MWQTVISVTLPHLQTISGLQAYPPNFSLANVMRTHLEAEPLNDSVTQ